MAERERERHRRTNGKLIFLVSFKVPTRGARRLLCTRSFRFFFFFGSIRWCCTRDDKHVGTAERERERELPEGSGEMSMWKNWQMVHALRKMMRILLARVIEANTQSTWHGCCRLFFHTDEERTGMSSPTPLFACSHQCQIVDLWICRGCSVWWAASKHGREKKCWWRDQQVLTNWFWNGHNVELNAGRCCVLMIHWSWKERKKRRFQ